MDSGRICERSCDFGMVDPARAATASDDQSAGALRAGWCRIVAGIGVLAGAGAVWDFARLAACFDHADSLLANGAVFYRAGQKD